MDRDKFQKEMQKKQHDYSKEEISDIVNEAIS